MKPISAYTSMQLSANTGSNRIAQNAIAGGKSSANPGLQKISNALAADQTRLSGLGQLQSLLTQFQTILQGMSAAQLSNSVTLSDPKLATVLTAGSGVGAHQLEVKQLAQNQLLASASVKSAQSAIGSGAPSTITIETGSVNSQQFSRSGSVQINIDQSNNSLAGISAALKAAGVNATVVSDSKGSHLEISGSGGSQSSLKISVSGDAGLKNLLSYDPLHASAGTMKQLSAAQQAIYTLDGQQQTSNSNIISSADGLKLQLQATGSSKISTSQDNQQLAGKISTFVQAYNQLTQQLGQLQSGALKSDAMLGKLQQQLSQAVQKLQNTQPGGLQQLGISVQANGQLQINQQQLQNAIKQSPEQLTQLFSHQGQGLSEMLSSSISKVSGISGNSSADSKAGGALQKEIATTGQAVQTKTKQQNLLSQLLKNQPSLLASLYGDNSGNAGKTAGGSGSVFDFLA